MEENKVTQNQTQNQNPNAQGSQGRRRRRKKKKNPNQGGQNQNAQVTQNQNAQKQSRQNKNQNQNQNQSQKQKQNNQNQAQNAQKQKQKNKQQNQQNQQNQQGKQNNAENRKDTYAYVLDGNLYINLTNKCSNGCDFCVRNERTSYYGNYLWLRGGDPTPEKVIAAVNGMGDLSRFKEVVFCGFGEPTYRVDEMTALCDYFHSKGLSTRLNTNGQGNLINKRDIVPELKNKIDLVNVSLNASCAEKYQKICRSQFGESGFDAMVEFAKLCKKNGVNCRFSIVDCIGQDEVEACKRLAESARIPLYIRDYITDSGE